MDIDVMHRQVAELLDWREKAEARLTALEEAQDPADLPSDKEKGEPASKRGRASA